MRAVIIAVVDYVSLKVNTHVMFNHYSTYISVNVFHVWSLILEAVIEQNINFRSNIDVGEFATLTTKTSQTHVNVTKFDSGLTMCVHAP